MNSKNKNIKNLIKEENVKMKTKGKTKKSKIRTLEKEEKAKFEEIVIYSMKFNKRIAFRINRYYFIKQVYDLLLPEVLDYIDIDEFLESEEVTKIIAENFDKGLRALLGIFGETSDNFNEFLAKITAIEERLECLVFLIVNNLILEDVYDLIEE